MIFPNFCIDSIPLVSYAFFDIEIVWDFTTRRSSKNLSTLQEDIQTFVIIDSNGTGCAQNKV